MQFSGMGRRPLACARIKPVRLQTRCQAIELEGGFAADREIEDRHVALLRSRGSDETRRIEAARRIEGRFAVGRGAGGAESHLERRVVLAEREVAFARVARQGGDASWPRLTDVGRLDPGLDGQGPGRLCRCHDFSSRHGTGKQGGRVDAKSARGQPLHVRRVRNPQVERFAASAAVANRVAVTFVKRVQHQGVRSRVQRFRASALSSFLGRKGPVINRQSVNRRPRTQR